MHYAVEPTERPEDTTVRYVIENKGSTLVVRAFSTGMLSAFAHNPTIAVSDIEGEITLNSDAIEQSTLRMVVNPASMTVIDDISEKDRAEINRRMHEEVLESDSYPNIIFECSRGSSSKTGGNQYWVALNGELTLHGVKRNQPASARVSLNGDTLGAAGEFSILLSAYEILPVSAVGGAVKLKDELKVSFDLTARKRP